MSYDYYAILPKHNGNIENHYDLVSGKVHGFTKAFFLSTNNKERTGILKGYIRPLKLDSHPLPAFLPAPCNFKNLPDPFWLGISVSFKLETPWYSKDDRPFHIMDNPVRKDRLFGVPFMSAASWKGILRWACRMDGGLMQFDGSNIDSDKSAGMKTREDPDWITHLFGDKKEVDETEDQKSGALVFYPTWFDSGRIDFEVINPHDREKRAGKYPIYYEVVPPGIEKYSFDLLYAPLPGQANRDDTKHGEIIKKLVDAIERLLEVYGISAKRTAGWGSARIVEWKGFSKEGGQFINVNSSGDFKMESEKFYSREREVTNE
jgi:CRISPR-associated protein Cmr2